MMATHTNRDKSVTFPNVRVAKSNVEGINEGALVDIMLYDQHFAVALSYDDRSVIRKFCCPRTARMDDNGQFFEVQMYDGYTLAFALVHICQAWLCDQFQQLQM